MWTPVHCDDADGWLARAVVLTISIRENEAGRKRGRRLKFLTDHALNQHVREAEGFG